MKVVHLELDVSNQDQILNVILLAPETETLITPAGAATMDISPVTHTDG